jgi:hypothetical protein
MQYRLYSIAYTGKLCIIKTAISFLSAIKILVVQKICFHVSLLCQTSLIIQHNANTK